MTRAISVIFAILILSSQIFAQEDTTTRKHSLYKGAWALQFGVSSYLSLQSFQNGLLSAKKQISDHSAFRVGIGVYSSIYDDKYYDYLNYRINLSGEYLYYTEPSSLVKFYYGGGPSLNYSWSKSERSTLLFDSQSWDKSNSFGFSVTGILGVEWFANESISFFAENYSSIDYKWSKRSDNNSSNKSSSFYINSFNARMGISLYF